MNKSVNSWYVGFFQAFLFAFSAIWCLSTIYRSIYDKQNFLFFAEFWVSLIVFASIIVITKSLKYKDIIESKSNLKPNIKSNINSAITSFSGAVAAVILSGVWFFQLIHKNIENDFLHLMNKTTPTLSVMTNMMKDCKSARLLWLNGIKNNHNWEMNIYEKSALIRSTTNAHFNGCFSDKELFEIIHNIRLRPINLDKINSAQFNWLFLNKDKFATIQHTSLPMTKTNWCLHTSKIWLKNNLENFNKNDIDTHKYLVKECNNKINHNDIILNPEDLLLSKKKLNLLKASFNE